MVNFTTRFLFYVVLMLPSSSAKKTICVRQSSEKSVSIKGGMAAGNFVNHGAVADINACLDQCCASQKGNIAFLHGTTCFAVHCFDLQACALEYTPSASSLTSGALYQVIAAYPHFKNMRDVNNVPENTRRGSEILNLKVVAESRKRKQETMTFEIVQGNRDKMFRLHPRSSTHRVKIYTTRNLDRELKSLYRFAIKAWNNVENTSTVVNITINVTDINDNAPQFEKPLYVFDVFSNMTKYARVGRVIASDKDVINSRLKYSIKSPSQLITLDEYTGEVRIQTMLQLDSGRTEEHDVTVTDGKYSTTTRLKINAYPNNVNRPKFQTNSYSVTINGQISIGSEVVQVVATDPDFGKLGELSYVIIKGDDDNVFSISTNGIIRTLIDIPPQSNKYNLTINVHDNGYPRLYASKPAHVIISLLWLRFKDAIYETVVLEDHEVSERIASVRAFLSVGGISLMAGQRKRSNNMINYYLEDTRGLGVFEMAENTGIITLEKPLDYERQHFYEFVVKADYEKSDSTRTLLTANAIFRLRVMDVNDNSPIFSPIYYTQDIWRSTKIRSPILKINATDKDSGSNGRIAYKAKSGNFNNIFRFNSDGMIFLRKSLEDVTTDVFNMTIIACDRGEPQPHCSEQPAIVTVYVQGSTTRGVLTFDQNSYNVSIWENGPSRSPLVRVRASTAKKSEITYSLDKDNQQVPFYVDQNGWVWNSKKLDREKIPRYTLKIIASTNIDRVSLTTFTHVTISLKDRNDNQPQFTQSKYSAIVTSNHVGTKLLQVHAVDKDKHFNAKVIYQIHGGRDQRYFDIDSSTGVITIQRSLPTKSLSVLKFLVSAQDKGRPPLTSRKPVPVFVLLSSTFPISVISLKTTTTTIKLQFTIINATLQDVAYIGVVVQEIGSIADYDKVTERPLVSWFYVHNMKGTGIYAQRYLTGKVDCTKKIKESKMFTFTVGTDGNKCSGIKAMFCNGKLQSEKKYRFQLVAFFKNGTTTKNLTSVESELSVAIETQETGSKRYAGYRSWRYDIIVILLGLVLAIIIVVTITRALILYRREKNRLEKEEAKEGISYPLSNPRYHRSEHTVSSRSTISFTEINKPKRGGQRSQKTSPCESEQLHKTSEGGVSRDSGCGVSVKSSITELRTAFFTFGKKTKDDEQEETSDKEMETVLN